MSLTKRHSCCFVDLYCLSFCRFMLFAILPEIILTLTEFLITGNYFTELLLNVASVLGLDLDELLWEDATVAYVMSEIVHSLTGIDFYVLYSYNFRGCLTAARFQDISSLMFYRGTNHIQATESRDDNQDANETEENVKEYTYDVFILHSESTDGWNCSIVDRILHHIEDVHGLRAFVPWRDSIPGQFKSVLFRKAIVNSKKILIFVTRDLFEVKLLNYILEFIHHKHEMRYAHVVLCNIEPMDYRMKLSNWAGLRHMIENAIFRFDLENYHTWSEERKQRQCELIGLCVKRDVEDGLSETLSSETS